MKNFLELILLSAPIGHAPRASGLMASRIAVTSTLRLAKDRLRPRYATNTAPIRASVQHLVFCKVHFAVRVMLF